MNKKKSLISVSLLVSAVLASANISFSSDRYVNEDYIYGLTNQDFKNIDVSAERYTEDGDGYKAGDLKPGQSEGYGGAIYNTGTINFLSSNNYTGNKADFGGAIFNQGVINAIENEVFSGNTAVADGGAIYNLGEIGSIIGEFTGNTASGINYDSYINSSGRGGAIFNYGGKVITGGEDSYLSSTIDSIGGKFENNSANLDGGAIYNSGEIGTIGGTFTNNTAQNGKGGAIYNDKSGGDGYTPPEGDGEGLKFGEIDTITGTYTGNSAAEGGGAVYNNGNIENINAAFNNNGKYSNDDKTVNTKIGGAIMNDGNINNLYDSTFKGNSSTEKGGAIYNTGTIKTQKTVNFDSNTSANGGALYNEGTYNLSRYSNFSNNKAEQNGGAIYNAEGGTITSSSLVNQTFTNNSAGEKGGAIYNEGSVSLGGDPASGGGAGKQNTVTFTGNSAADGGAIYNSGNLDVKQSIFNGNTATNSGGAVYNNDTLNIAENTFEANSADFGGALYNSASGKISAIQGTFNANTAVSDGGALYNIGSINTIGGSFTNNKAANKGGAVYNTGKLDKIANASFSSNSTTADNGMGGAIYNSQASNKLTVEETNFNSNKSANGGAIATDGALDITNSTFTQNSASGNGGAIYNIKNTTNINSSTFTSNSAVNGGAVANDSTINISNSKFNDNSASANGGAVYNKGNLTVTDSEFTNNSAVKGGAIYSEGGTVNINAQNKNITFSGNTAEKGGDIYLNNSTLNLNATEGKNIAFNGGIAGQGTINASGTILLNGAVTPDSGKLAFNLNSGVIKSSVDNYLDGTDLKLAEGTTLDLINNKTGSLNLNSLTSNNANLKIDMDFANSANPTDIINANTASGTLNLTDINLISEMEEGTNTITTDFNLGDLTLKLPENGINILTNDYLYTVTSKNSTLTIDRLHEEDGTATKIDGFALAVNQNDKIGGKVDVNLDDERSFSATRDIEITGAGLEKGWTGDLSGTKLTVNGNGYNLNGNDKAGLSVGDGQTLEFNDTNINGFKTSEDKKGALTVKDNGTLNINASNHDVTISGVTAGEGLDANAIYLDGTGSAKANLNTYNGKSITVDNDIRSAAVGNEVKMSGDGTITFNGEIHPVTLINENNNTVHNNYVNGATYNLKSGTVSFTKDEYLNGNGTANNLIFNGGTLNIANGVTSDISLNELSVNSNSNIMVDADLAAGKMDTISADKVNEIGEGINLNVSGINLISDTKAEKTIINFVNDESLMGHITSSVSNVAYSPIYRYGVGYDAATGNFEFVRGSSSDYKNVNPAIMVGPVAAQLGGYFNQLNAYDQAFSNMDMTMLMTKEQRQALKMYNKYALGKKAPVGDVPSTSGTVPEESAGLWARPYSSFENVDLKNGPNVSNVMFGSFFGGDTSIKELGHGFDGIFSVYAGYNGSHQVYNGNSLWQNGGTVGLTGTLYKGNWFGGWTVAGGLSGVDANTMYGSEDFMLWSAGTAIKTGYNWELMEGKFIIQPHYLMSYTFVDTQNYTNAAGYRISSDPLNAIQLVPGLKFIGNLKNGWQPYLGVDFVWNIMDKTKFSAAETSLPQLSVKPYVQYGLGVQKRWGDRFTGYLQAMFRNGGRNGVIFSAGFRSSFGHGK